MLKIKKIIKDIYCFIIKNKKAIVIISLILVFSFLFINNKIKNRQRNEINTDIQEVNTNSNYVTIKINGGVKNDYYGQVSKGMYLFDIIINYCCGLTDYANINNLDLIKKVDDDLFLSICEDGIIKNNKIEIIDYSNNKKFIYRTFEKEKRDESIIIYKIPYDMKEEDFLILINKNEEIFLESKIKVNINKASLDELVKVDGITEKRASSIIKYREEVSLFSSIEDVKKVSGIGEATFEKIKDYICVD